MFMRQAPPGPARLVDCEDTPWGNVKAAILPGIFGVISIFAGFGMTFAHGAWNGERVMMIVACFGVTALCGWLMKRLYRKTILSGAGELQVSKWPLQEGEIVALTFERRVDASCKLRYAHARIELQLYEKCGDHHKWETHETYRLDDCKIRQKNGWLQAKWKFEVPPPGGREDHIHTLMDAFWNMFGIGPRRRWRLLVDFAADGLPDTDSVFDLQICPAQRGRSPGRGGQAVGRRAS
jgi:hypothetical protein